MPLKTFESITYELTEQEERMAVDLAGWMSDGKVRKSRDMESYLAVRYPREIVGGARIRKIVHFIRVNRIVYALVSTSQGYWVTDNLEDIRKCIESMNQRANSIRAAARALEPEVEDQLSLF